MALERARGGRMNGDSPSWAQSFSPQDEEVLELGGAGGCTTT